MAHNFVPKYKVGDKLTIVANKTGHSWKVGDTVTVDRVDSYDAHYTYKQSGGYWFGEGDVAMIARVPGVDCLFTDA